MTQRIKPILFSAPMIRALLDGRKTQTRRLLKPQPPPDIYRLHGPEMYVQVVVNKRTGDDEPGSAIWGVYANEYGAKVSFQPGDLLWVRETWWLNHIGGRGGGIAPFNAYELHRRATDDREYFEVVGEDDPLLRFAGDNWRPSIFMPRWASRLTLEVTAVKVERLQAISEDDALAEGIAHVASGNGDQWADYPLGSSAAGWDDPRNSYRSLWNDINGPGAWDQNPWVVAVSFRVHTANVDAVLKQREAA